MTSRNNQARADPMISTDLERSEALKLTVETRGHRRLLARRPARPVNPLTSIYSAYLSNCSTVEFVDNIRLPQCSRRRKQCGLPLSITQQSPIFHLLIKDFLLPSSKPSCRARRNLLEGVTYVSCQKKVISLLFRTRAVYQRFIPIRPVNLVIIYRR
jgi:hypothetical protein